MEYLVRNASNTKRVFDEGDTQDDPMAHVIPVLISMLEDPPFKSTERPAPYYESQLDGWKKWWAATQSPRLTSIYTSVQDPKAHCLARMAEWGEPDAVSDLYRYAGQSSIPVLQRLARLGDKLHPSTWNTVPGRAQTVLARAGDQQEFERISKELDGLLYADAVEKLLYVGGQKSFERLLNAMSLRTFMSNDRLRNYRAIDGRSFVDVEGQKLRIKIMQALAQRVVNPPLGPEAPPTTKNIEKWRDWSGVNREKQVLKQPPN